jgi:YaiO family outer membrane protein
MSPRVLSILICAAAATLPAAAQTGGGQRLILSTELSDLNRGNRDWSEVSLRYVRLGAPRQSTELAVTGTSRFGLKDSQIDMAHTTPLSPSLVASVQASYSPTARVLPGYSVGANLQFEFAPAWLVHGGFRHTHYDSTDVNRLSFMLERYVGNFSASVAWSPVRALGTRSDLYELRGTWYHSEGGSIGFIAGRGDEATQLGAGVIALADVRSLALVGRHRLGPDYGLNYALSHTRQGRFYTRTGLSLGVQRDF